jgi:hypothetical protein
MKAEQGSQLLGSLKMAAGAAIGLGLLYAIFMTIREYVTNAGMGPNLGITFALSLVYCGVPLFVILFLAIGVITALQDRSSAQR